VIGASCQDMATSIQQSNACFNVLTVISWVLFSAFLLTQPWLANWANNAYGDFLRPRITYNITQGVSFNRSKFLTSYGVCTIPAAEYVCTDGENFVELAKKYRPNHPFACGCGEGILGESLCPRTSYGYTLSDYVSTPPALGAMIGLAIYPLMGARQLMSTIMEAYNPSKKASFLLMASLNSFQINFILWCIATVCIFPTSHALLTVTFLGSFMVFALTILYLFHKSEKETDLDQKVILGGAIVSFIAISLGSIPRILLVIDTSTMEPIFADWNNGGIGSYVFWFGEAVGLSVFFGLYPLVFLSKLITGQASWTTGEGDKFTELEDEDQYEYDEEDGYEYEEE